MIKETRTIRTRTGSVRPSFLLGWLVLWLASGSFLPGYSRLSAAETHTGPWLISPLEADVLAKGAKQPTPSGARMANDELIFEKPAQAGPILDVKEPQSNLLHSPINMRIRFIAKAAPVDMSSLEVHAQKWVLGSYRGNLDLLPKVKKFLVADGIEMNRQDIPKGRYRFVLAIKDIQGARSEAMLLLDIE